MLDTLQSIQWVIALNFSAALINIISKHKFYDANDLREWWKLALFLVSTLMTRQDKTRQDNRQTENDKKQTMIDKKLHKKLKIKKHESA